MTKKEIVYLNLGVVIGSAVIGVFTLLEVESMRRDHGCPSYLIEEPAKESRAEDRVAAAGE